MPQLVVLLQELLSLLVEGDGHPDMLLDNVALLFEALVFVAIPDFSEVVHFQALQLPVLEGEEPLPLLAFLNLLINGLELLVYLPVLLLLLQGVETDLLPDVAEVLLVPPRALPLRRSLGFLETFLLLLDAVVLDEILLPGGVSVVLLSFAEVLDAGHVPPGFLGALRDQGELR